MGLLDEPGGGVEQASANGGDAAAGQVFKRLSDWGLGITAVAWAMVPLAVAWALLGGILGWAHRQTARRELRRE